MTQYDVIIIGAGAAGLMSAIEAGKRGRSVLVIDHAKKIGEKIRISGGGRCNFTNIHTHANKFISKNPNFVKSALSQYTADDFIDLIKKHKIAFHEKKLGQLFCDDSAQQIIDMLLLECEKAKVTLLKDTKITNVGKQDDHYFVEYNLKKHFCHSLIVATGGLSIPKIGASKFGYDLAEQFGMNIVEPLPALVPLTFTEKLLNMCKELSGLPVEAAVSFKKTLFEEGMLFTHRGLSGPSILQISSYWTLGEKIQINLAPKANIFSLLQNLVKDTQKTVLISSHEVNLSIQLADEIILLTENKLHAGTPKKLIEENAFDTLFPKELIHFNKDLQQFVIRKK